MAYYEAGHGERIEIWRDLADGRRHQRALHWVTTAQNLSVICVQHPNGGVHTMVPTRHICPTPPPWVHRPLAAYHMGQVVDFLNDELVWMEGVVGSAYPDGLDIVSRNDPGVLLHFTPLNGQDTGNYRVALEWTAGGWISRTTGLPAIPIPPPPPLPVFPPPVVDPVPPAAAAVAVHPVPQNIPPVDLDIPSGTDDSSGSSNGDY